MPIFDFRCDTCGNEFERLVLSTSPTPECPACHRQELTKLVTMASVSSPSTKARALRDGKSQSRKIREDKAHEEHKRIHSHHEDHH